MWLCEENYYLYSSKYDAHFWVQQSPSVWAESTCWPLDPEGVALFDQWCVTPSPADQPLSGVMADWMDDHRDSLLTGAVGLDPAGRLDLLIRWLREVRCWGKESVSV